MILKSEENFENDSVFLNSEEADIFYKDSQIALHLMNYLDIKIKDSLSAIKLYNVLMDNQKFETIVSKLKLRSFW